MSLPRRALSTCSTIVAMLAVDLSPFVRSDPSDDTCCIPRGIRSGVPRGEGDIIEDHSPHRYSHGIPSLDLGRSNHNTRFQIRGTDKGISSCG